MQYTCPFGCLSTIYGFWVWTGRILCFYGACLFRLFVSNFVLSVAADQMAGDVSHSDSWPSFESLSAEGRWFLDELLWCQISWNMLFLNVVKALVFLCLQGIWGFLVKKLYTKSFFLMYRTMNDIWSFYFIYFIVFCLFHS